ncbi:hypothetical protein E2320_003416, partial [Naja naja]
MGNENLTSETGFILLGLTSHQKEQVLVFAVFLIIYLLTILGNLLIILLVHADAQLHTPMYFFLSHLAGLDIVYKEGSMLPTSLQALNNCFTKRKEQIMLFVIFLTIYLLTILLIILLVHIDAQLHTPMYFFLSELAGLD